jgi:methyl-accepting chemotaxis protein
MRLVGRYELREKIGEGAMAEVWRAYDPSIDRVLAIKLLKPEIRANQECAARFLREARAAGALAHPAIVTIYDVGEADGFPYIAMELLDGEPLDRALDLRGKFPPDAVLAIGAQLASALSYAHLSGVVHRDIKPSNIMLGADGKSVKILDFGIARVTEGDGALGEATRTVAGQVLGTPRYMSPEQALGRAVDGRSDLFSTGSVLFELITGQPAFTGTSAATLALQITQANPAPIASLVPHCPGGLRHIVEKLLAKRPERRFADGAELGRALDRENKAYEAVQADAAARGRYLPLQARLTLAVVLVTFLALTASIGTVLNRQYAAMERMALVSGASIASFVASNAALTAVDNAGLEPDQRDWAPVQAFIAAASKDESVRWMTMVDSDGVVRGSSNSELLNTRYRGPGDDAVIFSEGDTTATNVVMADGHAGFRFVHPILYAGRRFGTIEVSMSKAGLDAAAATTRLLLLGLGALVLLVTACTGFIIARLIKSPLRRLKYALQDTAMGNLDFRISHHRKDEFGELFDSFNLSVAAMQERLEASDQPSAGLPLDATRIVQAPTTDDGVRTAPEGTPFDPNWRQAS